MKRRNFLGVAACGALAPGILFANRLENRLNWKCEVIETLPHNQAARYPVVTDVSLQPNGSLIAIVGDDHHVCLYDQRQDRYIEHLEKHTDWVRTAKFSPDGKQLVTAGNDRQIYFWDSSNWNTPVAFRTHREAILGSAFSPNGERVGVVGFERKARVYSNQGMIIHELECPCADMHSIGFSPDGRWIAAGGRNGSIRLWDAATGKTTTEFKAHQKRIRSLEFVSNQEIVSAGDDQQVRVTNFNQPEQARVLPRVAAKLYCIKVLSNGLLATGGSDNKIRIWRLNNLTQLGTLEGHTGTVTSLDAQNSQLVSGSYDTQVRLWQDQSVTTASSNSASSFQNAGFQPNTGFGASKKTNVSSSSSFQPPRRVGSQPAANGWNRKIN